MKVFLALATLVSLVASRPTCSRHPTPSITPVYGNTSSNGTNTTTPSAGSSNSTGLASGWYPGWSSDTLSPSQIPWDKYTSLTYAFALTTPDLNQLNITDPESALRDFVSQAHSHNVKALISVGGWTGSRFFSSAVATAENRTAFTKTLMDFASKYQLDGIDFE
ncbi:Endochitinase [Leucoagaricus sp. SymC.cos]|nr:Endochitinase [Leucoagaricus sp. SymC.cos]